MTTSPFLSQPAGGVLIASSSSSLREQVLLSLEQSSRPVHEACGGADALVKLESGNWQVLYSSSQVDQHKVGKLALAIQVAFQELGVFPASTTAVPVDLREPMPFNTVQAVENAQHSAALGRVASTPTGGLSGNAPKDLTTLRRDLQKVLSAEIASNAVALRAEPDGLVISLREMGFFESGSATVRQTSLPTLGHIASLLAQRDYRIRIEGHTDDVPIHNARFSDNWELSTARAAEVVRLLIVRYGFPPSSLSAAGFAEYHPIAQNDTPERRAQNRRVDVVILGKLPASTAALSEINSAGSSPSFLPALPAPPASPPRPSQPLTRP